MDDKDAELQWAGDAEKAWHSPMAVLVYAEGDDVVYNATGAGKSMELAGRLFFSMCRGAVMAYRSVLGASAEETVAEMTGALVASIAASGDKDLMEELERHLNVGGDELYEREGE